jgi:hypothetical protein
VKRYPYLDAWSSQRLAISAQANLRGAEVKRQRPEPKPAADEGPGCMMSYPYRHAWSSQRLAISAQANLRGAEVKRQRPEPKPAADER